MTLYTSLTQQLIEMQEDGLFVDEGKFMGRGGIYGMNLRGQRSWRDLLSSVHESGSKLTTAL